MKRGLVIMFLMLASAAAGAWLPAVIAGQLVGGPDVPCIRVSGESICKGSSVDEIPWHVRRDLGGIVALSCSYERPGEARRYGDLFSLSEMVGGCSSGRYVVSLSDGAIWTNFWVDGGRLAQIDRFNANPLEL